MLTLERKYEKINIKELYKKDSTLDINVINEAKINLEVLLKIFLANSDSRIINSGIATLYKLIDENKFLIPLETYVNKVKKIKKLFRIEQNKMEDIYSQHKLVWI